MTPSPPGKVLIQREQAIKAAADYWSNNVPKQPTLDNILVECRKLYELTKIQHHEGRVSLAQLEKIRRQLELCEASAERRKAKP